MTNLSAMIFYFNKYKNQLGAGIEPATLSLPWRCSTTELPQRKVYFTLRAAYFA